MPRGKRHSREDVGLQFRAAQLDRQHTCILYQVQYSTAGVQTPEGLQLIHNVDKKLSILVPEMSSEKRSYHV